MVKATQKDHAQPDIVTALDTIPTTTTTTTTTKPDFTIPNPPLTKSPVTTEPRPSSKPLSPTPSTETTPILGGEDLEFDSIYFKAALKALFSSVVTEHSATLSAAAKAIEASTSQCQQASLAVDASTKECKEATAKVDKLVLESHLFLDSLQAAVENLQKRQAIKEANETLHANVSKRLTQLEAELAVENQIMDELHGRRAQLKLQTHKLRTANVEINDLKSEREVISDRFEP
uniref:Uncharacterized protein n=1 Tax=Lactuca sativa TaxID=4236 RepID=A0A9R1V532_LACSA|nr:hypothetical protein LSAT_V11C700366820 [Lactuca sativa]